LGQVAVNRSIDANPDYKQIFDSGRGRVRLPTYAPNQWPDALTDFKAVIENYYARALAFSGDVRRAEIGEDVGTFAPS
jgi:isopenicillin N synthase-like dioxygenase